jgi:cyanobactin maturation PatA/PatG family protease
MDIRSALTGIQSLHGETLGDPGVCVAVVDGPVDLTHPCFEGADLRRVATLVQDPAGSGPMSAHGTHVTSLIFGQPGSPVFGVAPRCRGLILPVYRDDQKSEGRLSQLDLARAIEQAVLEGAHIVSVSGGQRSPTGQADGTLQHALQLCERNNVLVIAATGNDGCECLHVPAALPSVLAVGALGKDGQPLPASNWGDAYRSNGVLAHGEGIVGAVPGGGTASMTGSSFATALVAGVAALLLSIQRGQNQIDPRAAAKAILRTTTACQPSEAPECHPYLTGVLDIPEARAYVKLGGRTTVADLDGAQTPPPAAEVAAGQAGLGRMGAPEAGVHAAGTETPLGPTAAPEPSAPRSIDAGITIAGIEPSAGASPRTASPPSPVAPTPAVSTAGPSLSGTPAAAGSSVVPSGDCDCHGNNQHKQQSYVYVLGSIGFDFGTEARRDTFRQLMPDVERPYGEEGVTIFVAPNPYDVFQLTDYLNTPSRHSESTKLIWTVNLDLTPIYAIEAEMGYPEDVYAPLRDALRRGALPIDNEEYVARVSIPAVLTNRTVQLFSGQRVPVVKAQPRGLYMWNEPALVKGVVDAVRRDIADVDVDYISQLIRIFLDKVYYECRNLGQSPPDRALNYAATNAYQFAAGIAQGILSGKLVPGAQRDLYTLDTIDVSKSPYCRMDSDCWDVRVIWFNPENDRRAKSVYQYTIDVSDELPVSLAPFHQYLAT